MISTDETWNIHWGKAEAFLEQARFLRDANMFEGAYNLALGSCLKASKAISLRLRGERDEYDYVQNIRRSFNDGRLPSEMAGPFNRIMHLHGHDMSTSKTPTKDNVDEAIALAETFHHALLSASDLTTSHFSPAVMKAAKKKGIPMPPTPFA